MHAYGLMNRGCYINKGEALVVLGTAAAACQLSQQHCSHEFFSRWTEIQLERERVKKIRMDSKLKVSAKKFEFPFLKEMTKVVLKFSRSLSEPRRQMKCKSSIVLNIKQCFMSCEWINFLRIYEPQWRDGLHYSTVVFRKICLFYK